MHSGTRVIQVEHKGRHTHRGTVKSPELAVANDERYVLATSDEMRQGSKQVCVSLLCLLLHSPVRLQHPPPALPAPPERRPLHRPVPAAHSGCGTAAHRVQHPAPSGRSCSRPSVLQHQRHAARPIAGRLARRMCAAASGSGCWPPPGGGSLPGVYITRDCEYLS